MSKLKIILVASAVVTWAPVALAEAAGPPAVWINPGLLSHHLERDRGHREDNWGVGIEAIQGNHGVMGGTYINSERARSRYLGYQWRPLHWDTGGGLKVHAGLALSLVDGYADTNAGGAFLAPLPVVALEYGRVGGNFVLLPNKHGGALALQLKLRLW